MNIEEVKLLIEAFYNGETNSDEEQALLRYFEGENIPDELVEERDLFLQLNNTQPIEIPVGLESRITNLIDTLAESELEKVAFIVPKRINRSQLWIRVGGVAASIAILFSIGAYINNSSDDGANTPSQLVQNVELKDSFKDPNEAYREAEKALLLVSANLNKGVNSISVVSYNIDKSNTILDKSVNRINIKKL